MKIQRGWILSKDSDTGKNIPFFLKVRDKDIVPTHNQTLDLYFNKIYSDCRVTLIETTATSITYRVSHRVADVSYYYTLYTDGRYIITGTVYNGSKAIHLSNNIVTISTIYPYLPSNGLNQTVVSVRPFYYRQRTANSRYMKKVDVTSLMNFEVSCGKDPVRSNYGITGASGMIESDNYEAHTIELFLGSSVTMTCPYRPVDDEGTSTEVSVSDMAKNYLNYDIEIHGIYRSL